MPPSHLDGKCFFIKSIRKKIIGIAPLERNVCLFIGHQTEFVLWWWLALPFDIVCYPIKTVHVKSTPFFLWQQALRDKSGLYFPLSAFLAPSFLQQPARILGYVVANVLFYDREDFALDVTCIHAKKRERNQTVSAQSQKPISPITYSILPNSTP